MLKVTLKKSLIGSLPNQKATAASLGLRKIGDSIHKIAMQIFIPIYYRYFIFRFFVARFVKF